MSGRGSFVDGSVKYFASKSAITAGPLVRASLDEHGVDVAPSSAALETIEVWTGTNATGLKSNLHCDGWTSISAANGDRGLSGNPTFLQDRWTPSDNNAGAGFTCVTALRLYCFEQ